MPILLWIYICIRIHEFVRSVGLQKKCIGIKITWNCEVEFIAVFDDYYYYLSAWKLCMYVLLKYRERFTRKPTYLHSRVHTHLPSHHNLALNIERCYGMCGIGKESNVDIHSFSTGEIEEIVKINHCIHRILSSLSSLLNLLNIAEYLNWNETPFQRSTTDPLNHASTFTLTHHRKLCHLRCLFGLLRITRHNFTRSNATFIRLT